MVPVVPNGWNDWNVCNNWNSVGKLLTLPRRIGAGDLAGDGAAQQT